LGIGRGPLIPQLCLRVSGTERLLSYLPLGGRHSLQQALWRFARAPMSLPVSCATLMTSPCVTLRTDGGPWEVKHCPAHRLNMAVLRASHVTNSPFRTITHPPEATRKPFQINPSTRRHGPLFYVPAVSNNCIMNFYSAIKQTLLAAINDHAPPRQQCPSMQLRRTPRGWSCTMRPI
jgi:hypothetical protein